jgi:hypothetical protein
MPCTPHIPYGIAYYGTWDSLMRLEGPEWHPTLCQSEIFTVKQDALQPPPRHRHFTPILSPFSVDPVRTYRSKFLLSQALSQSLLMCQAVKVVIHWRYGISYEASTTSRSSLQTTAQEQAMVSSWARDLQEHIHICISVPSSGSGNR